MIGLALAYLRDRAGQTALNVLLLALAVASLVALLLVSARVEDRFARDAAGVDLVVGAKGSPLQLILSAVYHLDQPTGNVPVETLALLRADPGVARAIPLALGDNFRGFRIVGTEPAFLALHGSKLVEGRLWEAPMEAVIGAEVARRTGARLGQKFLGSHGLGADEAGAMAHDHAPFVVTGILAPTGTVADRLILTSVESVWDVHGIAHDEAPGSAHAHDDGHDHGHAHDHDHAHAVKAGPAGTEGGAASPLAARGGPAPEVTAVLVSYASPAAAIRLPAAINRQTALQAAVPAQETARFLTLFDGAIAGARALALLIAAAAALSIFTVLLSAARARAGDLALLRVMGASPARVFGTILAEGLLVAAAGALLGLLIGHAAVEAAARAFPTLGGIGLSGLAFHPGEWGILAGALVLGALAALVPAAAVFRTDLAATLARAQ
ncbi:MAG: ABC transporter permease [Thermaurantiacus tibetensis]